MGAKDIHQQRIFFQLFDGFGKVVGKRSIPSSARSASDISKIFLSTLLGGSMWLRSRPIRRQTHRQSQDKWIAGWIRASKLNPGTFASGDWNSDQRCPVSG